MCWIKKKYKHCQLFARSQHFFWLLIHLGAVRLWQTFFPALVAFLVSMLLSRKCLAAVCCKKPIGLIKICWPARGSALQTASLMLVLLPPGCVVLTQSCLQTVCHSQNYHWSLPIEPAASGTHTHPVHCHSICTIYALHVAHALRSPKQWH